LQTNLVIATNERTYLIDAKSIEGTSYHSAIEWTYPLSELMALRRAAASRIRSASSTTIRNYAYVVKVPPTGAPPWAPVSVYDDGSRMYLRFSSKIDTVRRPPLFAVGKDGSVRMINYVVENEYYIIPELVDHLELRLGHDRVVIQKVTERSRNPFARLFNG